MSDSGAIFNRDLNLMQIPRLRDHKLADWMHERLVSSINDFENKLPMDFEAGGRLVSFGQSVEFCISDIGYWNPDLIIFHGILPDGGPVKLIQHVSQLSILLVAVKRKNPNGPRRKIGFGSEGQASESPG